MTGMKKILVALSLCSFLSVEGCKLRENYSEVKVEPITTAEAVKAAIAIIASAAAGSKALNESHVRAIIDAIKRSSAEIKAHMDAETVREWDANVRGIEENFKAYAVTRQDKTRIQVLKVDADKALAQLRSILDSKHPQQSHRAALALNSVTAMLMVMNFDYTGNDALTKSLARETMAYNKRLLDIPDFPQHTMNGGVMSFQNCKVLMAPFTGDLRNNIMWSALGPWVMGYHKDHQFRYYKNGHLAGFCFENGQGQIASRVQFSIRAPNGSNSWADIAPTMHRENAEAATSNPIYKAVQESDAALKAYVGS